MHKRLVIIGASGHGKVVADVAMHIGKYKNIIFLDDDDSLKESLGIPVLGNSNKATEYIGSSELFVAIGNPRIRKKIQDSLEEQGAIFARLIHPNASIGKNVQINTGTIVMAGAVVNCDTRIGRGCIINTSSSVDHDCILSDYVHISVGTHVAGNVKIGENTWLGAGAIVSNNINICKDSMIGAGAVVIQNINEPGTYVGVPARRNKRG